jgi:hypothetical protein
MTPGFIEHVVRERIVLFADALPVETELGRRKVRDRAAIESGQWSIVAWPRVPPKARRMRLRRPVLVVFAAAASVAAGTVGVLTLAPGPAAGAVSLPEPLPFTQGTHDTAVTRLQRAADLQDAEQTGIGPIRFARTQNYSLQTDIASNGSSTTVETTVRDVWVTADGTGLANTALQDTTRTGTPVGAAQTQMTDNSWQDPNAKLPSTLPALRAALLGSEATGNETNLILAQEVLSDLGQGTATPAQTATMYRLLAAMPGVFDAGTVTDSTGRSGHAVGVLTGYFDAGKRCTAISSQSSSMTATLAAKHALGEGITYLVLDPSSGQPLLVESIDSPNPPCALHLASGPTVEQYNLILKTGQVNAIGATMPEASPLSKSGSARGAGQYGTRSITGKLPSSAARTTKAVVAGADRGADIAPKESQT